MDKFLIIDGSNLFLKMFFGILPNQYAYFKSFVGDHADNIKGAEKIGVKTAAALLNS